MPHTTEERKELFSPGEWYVLHDMVKAQLTVDNSAIVCQAMYKEDLTANLSLLSAAPDLYRALSNMVSEFENYGIPANRFGDVKSIISNAKYALHKAISK